MRSCAKSSTQFGCNRQYGRQSIQTYVLGVFARTGGPRGSARPNQHHPMQEIELRWYANSDLIRGGCRKSLKKLMGAQAIIGRARQLRRQPIASETKNGGRRAMGRELGRNATPLQIGERRIASTGARARAMSIIRPIKAYRSPRSVESERTLLRQETS